jgi:hypothetical protein
LKERNTKNKWTYARKEEGKRNKEREKLSEKWKKNIQ